MLYEFVDLTISQVSKIKQPVQAGVLHRIVDMKINDIFGEFLHDFRTEHGLTLDQVATTSCEYGTGWNTSVISSFERGKRSATIPNMLVLLQALNDLTGENLRLANVFDEWPVGTDLEITDTFTVDCARVSDMLEGEAVDIKPLPKFGTPEYVAMKNELFDQARDAVMNDAKHPRSDVLMFTRMIPPTLAERRAAERLNIDAVDLIGWCHQLYGCRLSDEISNRVGADSSPQKRGRATREIQNEIQQAINVKLDDMAADLVNGDI